MKNICYTISDRRRAAARLLFVAAAVCGGCLGSCTDDTGSGLEMSKKMAFLCSISTEADSTVAPRGAVAAFEGWSSPLYLHTSYVDTIATRNTGGGATRAAKRTDMYDEGFYVTAYNYTGDWSNTTANNVYFYNLKPTKNSTSYVLSDDYYWPGTGKMRFFAHAPIDNESYKISEKAQAGEPTITVTVPSDAENQLDLLVAASEELSGNANAVVNLNFKHALAAVRFECGSAMQKGTVKSISLSGIYSKGTYKMNTNAWEIDKETTASFTQELNKAITNGAEGEDITTEAQTFMMIPQTLAEGAKLTVVFVDSSNNEHTLTAPIKGNVWAQGKTTVYKITTNSINWTYTFSVAESMTFDHTGGTQQYTVTSYKTNVVTNENQPVAWKVTGYDDSTTKPAWLETFTASGDGSAETAGKSYDAVISPQTVTETDSHTYRLETATAKGTEESPYNLATEGGTTSVNTANCYMVSAPGYYSFPLVYGNAIKNGSTNESAYKTDVTGDYVLSPLVNHAGAGITDPYIKNNSGCTPSEAELVWQDAKDLVTGIKYDSEKEYISFHVDQSTIQQGNAVIAIKDADGNVLWSWHIWVTDINIDGGAIACTNYQSETINFSPVNLGWCEGETMTFAARSCVITFAAEEGENTGTITVTQSGAEESINDGCTFYQWGRKDPFPSFLSRTVSTCKTWYDKDGKTDTKVNTEVFSSAGLECVKNCILRPYNMEATNSNVNNYSNLWSVNNSIIGAVADGMLSSLDLAVVKTIYDPSPVGFSVPKGNAYTGFTTTGEQMKSFTELNGTWDSSNFDYSFYTNSEKTQTILFPVLGFRKGNSNGSSEKSLYWSAIPYTTGTGYYLEVYSRSKWVTPKGNSDRRYGAFVRPAKETTE